jgi:hypothetical protein
MSLSCGGACWRERWWKYEQNREGTGGKRYVAGYLECTLWLCLVHEKKFFDVISDVLWDVKRDFRILIKKLIT